jgi:hypothetical protein
MSLLELFCDVDDFCQHFEPKWEQYQLESGLRQRRRQSRLSLSEVMTIVIHFHQSNYRTFKAYYTKCFCQSKTGSPANFVIMVHLV